MSDSDTNSTDSEYKFSYDNIPDEILNLNYDCVCIYTFSVNLDKCQNNLFLELYNYISQKDIKRIFKTFFTLSKKTRACLTIDCVEYMRVQVVNTKTSQSTIFPLFFLLFGIHPIFYLRFNLSKYLLFGHF